MTVQTLHRPGKSEMEIRKCILFTINDDPKKQLVRNENSNAAYVKYSFVRMDFCLVFHVRFHIISRQIQLCHS